MKKIFYSIILLTTITISTSSFAQGGYYDRGPSIINRPWSPKAKSAVLGAGGGAILGAMLSREHGQGALIGAILGGGAGYLYGQQQERRYDPAYSEDRGYRHDEYRNDYDRREYRDRDDHSAYDRYRYSGNNDHRYNR